MVDPWYDYLALPIAPAILAVQFLSLLAPNRTFKLVVGGACTAAVLGMFAYVLTLDVEGEGANIGAGVLFLWPGAALGMLLAAATRGREPPPPD